LIRAENGERPRSGLLSCKQREFLSKYLCGRLKKELHIMSFGLYAIGFAILIGGLIYAAHLVHLPTHWIIVGAIILLGIGILSGVKATRQRDPAA
jgi:hypothetical protein